MYFMNRNKKLVAMLVGTLVLTNTVMPVCAEPKQPTLEYGEDFEYHLNDTENVKKQGNINLLNPSVGLVSNSNNMNINGVFYQIQPNDTLSSIAKKNNTTVEMLMENTGLTNPNKIKAGDILVSPYITEEFVLSKGQDPKQNEKKRAKVVEVAKREITESDRNILRSLFNAEEYAKMYPDVAEACKGSIDPLTFEQKLFYHFINNGIWEGRQPSASFSVAAYASAYSDLRESFGSHIVEYYKHYYNTTVNGTENRTITTVQKAQDAGIKVTDFSGNTVAVDEAGNIVTGEEADKIAAEKNLREPLRPVITTIPNVTVSADFNEETEKEETQAPSSEDKKEPSAPVAPTKTFAKAYKEWLADEPGDDCSGDAYFMWLAKEPKLADYADGREFLAKKEAWEKERPDYDAYLATTAYASDYEAWQVKEPKLADYTILVGNQTAEEKYNEDFAKWQELAPKPEDYIQYTSFEADYNAWLAAAPVPVEGKYETAEKAMEAYTEAHTEWEANAPKQSDYFDEECYNNAVTEWNNSLPIQSNYHNYDDYVKAIESWEKRKPKEGNYIDNEAYSNAIEMHENEKPEWEDYFKQEEYMAAQDAYTEYSEKLAAYEAYKTAKTAYDAEKAKYDAYKAWEDKPYFEYGSDITVKYYFCDEYYDNYGDAWQVRNDFYKQFENNNSGVGIDEVLTYEIEEHYFYKEQKCTDEDAALKAAREGSKPTDLPKDTENAPVAPEVVESPGDPVDNPDDNQSAYLTSLSINGGAIDKDSAMNLYNDALATWKAAEPKKENFLDYSSYHILLEEWRNNEPNEMYYFNYDVYNNMEEAKAAYDAALAAAGSKPMEEDFFGDKAKEANITDKEVALEAFEEATNSYAAENPEPTESEYTSQVIDAEKKAEYDKAVEDYNAAKPSETDDKYIEEAKETEEYKDAVVEHEADKPDQSNYVDDIYETEADAVNAFNSDHSSWEGEKPSEDSYIAGTTYADDFGAWEESEPDFGEYFGIEVAE